VGGGGAAGPARAKWKDGVEGGAAAASSPSTTAPWAATQAADLKSQTRDATPPSAGASSVWGGTTTAAPVAFPTATAAVSWARLLPARPNQPTIDRAGGQGVVGDGDHRPGQQTVWRAGEGGWGEGREREGG